MDQPTPPTRRLSFINRFLLWIAYVDTEIARFMPKFDMEQARGLALVALGVFAYQTSLLALVANRIFAPAGEIQFDFILVSFFIAAFYLILDRQIFYGPGWFSAGQSDLAKAGIDLRGGAIGQAKTGLLLAVRIALSAAMSVLLGLVFSIIIFAKDVDRRVEKNYQTANATLIDDEKKIVDEDIKRAADAEAAQQARVASLSSQVSVVRQSEIDPPASDPQAAQAEKELDDLLAQKKKADDEIKQAEDLGSRELGGFKGDNLSGSPGPGWRHAAEVEMAKNARIHSKALAIEIDKSRARLDAIRKHLAGSSEAAKQHAKEQLPAFSEALSSEESKLTALTAAHNDLVNNREQSIRARVEQSPKYVAVDNGFLAQLTALDQIAHENPKIGWVILLVEIVSAGLELAGVLAKVLAHMPSNYAMTVARNAWLFAVSMVEDMTPSLEPKEPGGFPPTMPANDNDASRPNGLGGVFGLTEGPQPKRKRGRPRKNPPPAEVH